MTYTITDPASPRVQAVFIRAHLRAVAAGMRPRAPMTRGGLLDLASSYTGKGYKLGQYQEAIADLTTFLDSFKMDS